MNISVILPILVSFAGVYLLIKLRFFFLLHPMKTAKRFFKSLKIAENRKSLYLALAGTLGVGNIFGVAAGIIIGGAGSVFWLLVSGLFSMIIKYAEALLAQNTLTETDGGMHLVIRSSFNGSIGRVLSYVYTGLCLFLALFMGAAVQSKAAYGVCNDLFGTSGLVFSLLFSALIAFSVMGGANKIEKATSLVIPLTTIIYILLAIAVIFKNCSYIDDAALAVISEAFSPLSGVGGISSFLISKGIKEGFARGILSNEAGVGTSAMAHSRSKERHPRDAGLYGMCEVFFDTIVLCPLTAFMILTSVRDTGSFISPMSLISEAVFGTLGVVGMLLLVLCILSFAYATVTCWFYYGEKCTSYLFSGRFSSLFKISFFIFIALGTVFADGMLLALTDIIILFMSVLTLSLIMKESSSVKRLTLNI